MWKIREQFPRPWPGQRLLSVHGPRQKRGTAQSGAGAASKGSTLTSLTGSPEHHDGRLRHRGFHAQRQGEAAHWGQERLPRHREDMKRERNAGDGERAAAFPDQLPDCVQLRH